MYFLNDFDKKILLNKLLPLARDIGVSPELRGWSWSQEPIKPLYDLKMPMYLTCSKYCPTGRDVYLSMVKGAKPRINYKISLGKLIHGAISDSFLSFIDKRKISFGEWWNNVRKEEIPLIDERMRAFAESIWNYIIESCRVEYENHRMQQPYATERDLMATAIPFLIEHKLSGELLGLSGLLSPDCYDYLRKIIFDVKVQEILNEEMWQRL
ncbi:MAG: CRISPR-associated protein Cas4, partial [Candidatus Methanomethylicaceae archaeon]